MSKAFLSFAKDFTSDLELVPVDGEYYDLPGSIVYHTATHRLPEKGRLEINVISPEASHLFAWQVEITLKDKLNDEFIHVIVRTDGVAEETYGKTVLPIDQSRESEILAALDRAVD